MTVFNANTVEALLIIEVYEHDSIENSYVMPFSPMVEGVEYTLVVSIAEMQKNVLPKSRAFHL